MEEIKKEVTEQPKKLSYEELETVVHELHEQLEKQQKICVEKLQEMNYANLFKRMDYLFKVVEFKDMFTSDFVVGVVEELEKLLTLEKEEEKEE